MPGARIRARGLAQKGSPAGHVVASRRANAQGVQTAIEAPNSSGDSQWPRTSTKFQPVTMRSSGQAGSGSKTYCPCVFGSKGLKAGDGRPSGSLRDWRERLKVHPGPSERLVSSS